MFADDLLMFCKGTAQSIMLLVRAFSTFSKTPGLSMNNSKSEVYFNGMTNKLKDDIIHVTGFVEGQMPFRYLGFPIQPGRISKRECHVLTEKILNKVRSLGARKLSYTGRLTLINLVLNTLYNCWANIFILPKNVIRRIEANEGGLGVKNAEIWNIVTVAKLVDWLYCKADRLWIKWVNQIYIKQQSWHDYRPAADVTWTWKNIFKVKEIMKPAYSDGKWIPDDRGYTVSRGYDWLRPHQTKPVWYETVWCSWNIPKYSLIFWLIRNNGINTREKLFRIGCCNSDSCCICEAALEIQEHLFFECGYSKLILGQIKDWCRLQISSTGGVSSTGSKVQKNVYALVLAASYYHVWT
ncbi:uncharacterized protein LOC141601416 [Silene latifolia]|uniref:uncharacterized protein LOC141601416 n=1 Tax=Silene latifolia TaxID=37657 RepID=UPI003D784C8B